MHELTRSIRIAQKNAAMNILPLLLIALISAFPLSSAAQTADELIKSATTTPDKATQARLYKQAGDKLVAQDRIDDAADAFSKALAAGRESFSSAERIQMAIYLSWADRLAESKEELTRVLAREPKILQPATTSLASCRGLVSCARPSSKRTWCCKSRRTTKKLW